MWGVNDRIGKGKEKVPGKYEWETLAVIPLMPLVWVNNRLPIFIFPK